MALVALSNEKMEYPLKLFIAEIIIIICSSALMGFGFMLVIRLIRNSHVLDKLMTGSIVCIVLNLALLIVASILNIFDLLYTYDYGGDPYPNYENINKTTACLVALYSMLLFNAFLLDIYKWGLFIVSSN